MENWHEYTFFENSKSVYLDSQSSVKVLLLKIQSVDQQHTHHPGNRRNADPWAPSQTY